MKKCNSSYILIIICLFFFHFGFAQNVDPQRALPLDSTLIINEQIASFLLKYKLILVGEMHGTQEPVKFMTQLAKRLAMSKKVLVGFEISEDELGLKMQRINAAQLRSTLAFKNTVDGKNSQAWFDAITELSALRGIDVFFFDQTQQQKNMDRDSAMYLNIKTRFMEDTNRVIITISGNYHNQLIKEAGIASMGSLLARGFPGQVLAINHLYSYGNMYNRTKEGLGLKPVEAGNRILRSLTTSPDYFYPDPGNGFSKAWNAFLFTTKINASFPIKNE